MDVSDGPCGKLLLDFTNFIGKPEDFLETRLELAERLQQSTKGLYDLSKTTDTELIGDALPELIVEGFDDEQVWQEIELQNEPCVSSLLADVSRMVAGKHVDFFVEKHAKSNTFSSVKSNLTHVPEDDMEEDDEEGNNDNDGPSDMSEEENLEEDEGINFGSSDGECESEEEKELKELLEKVVKQTEGEDVDESSDDDSESEDTDTVQADLPNRKASTAAESSKSLKSNLKKRKTVVDDKFFKLADMESFLEMEDAREERKIRRDKNKVEEEEEDSSDEEDEDIDMFGDLSSEDGEGQSGRDLKYTDFFDPPDDEQHEEPNKKKSRVKFEVNEEDQASDEDEAADSSQEDSNESMQSESEGEDVADILGGQKQQNKSSFEQRQERLQKKISDLEEASIAEKPWQLLGEVSAETRPENSLLEEDLDHEHATRQAPVITEETSKKLEDIIIQRIKDKAWDDVERKDKPKEDAPEYKKRLVLDQEKSKQSLGDIYEQEYLKQQQKEEVEKEDPQHEVIHKMMTSLFVKLDALSNFHYTPKQSVPDVKIVSNMPSISMEEVAPIIASDQTLLAPEEIQEKTKTELKGDTEKTKTDKKRERREKKARQHKKRMHREKKEQLKSLLNPGLGNKYAKEKAMQELKKQSKSIKGGVTIIGEEKKKSKSTLTSSAQFFSQLQDEVTSHIHAKKIEARKKKKAQEKSSKKLKL